MSAGREIYNPGHITGAGFTAAAALGAGIGVKVASVSTINVAGGATGDHALGFLKNAVASGGIPEIITSGEALAVVSGTISAVGTELKLDAAGKVLPTAAAGDIISAIAMDTGAVADRIRVQIVNYERIA